MSTANETRNPGHPPFLSTVLWMFFWVILLTPSSLVHDRDGHQDQTPTPRRDAIWRFDLRSAGYAGSASRKEQWGFHLRPQPICFSGDDLVATFITRENITTLTHRDQPDDSRPLRLHGVFLDAQTGKISTIKEWSISRPGGGIIPVGHGEFAVLTPAMLALYSPNGDMLKQLRLSSKQEASLWDLYSSPSGASILAEYHYPEVSLEWIDTASLEVKQTWNDFLPGVSISDVELAFPKETYFESQKFTTHEVLIRGLIAPLRTFCKVRIGWEDDEGCGYPQFISNDLISLWGPHGLALFRRTGEPVSRISFPKDEWIGSILYPSADGNRIAVTVWTHKGGSEVFDVSWHSVLKRVIVYDIPSRQWTYVLDAKKQKLRDISGLALSPDGSLIGILADGVVEVYRISAP